MQLMRAALSRRALLVALAIGALLTVQAAGLTFTVEDRSVAPNGTVVVQVVVADALDLGGADMVLLYDPAVLRFESAEPVSLADRARVSATETGTGRVAVAVASPRSLTGSGPIVALTFAAIGPAGSRSAITVESVRSVTVDGDPVPAEAVNGTVSVGSGPRTPLSALGAAAAFAAAAAWRLRGRRRRSGR